MSGADAPLPDMRRLLRRTSDPRGLDGHTVERLLTDRLPPDDAPPFYRGVARVLEALGKPGSESELVGEGVVVPRIATVAGASRPIIRRSSMSRNARSTKVALVAGVSGAIVLLGGLVAAGALPGAADGAATDALTTVGIEVSRPNDASDGHADVRGKSADHTPTTLESPVGANGADAGQGGEISETARTTEEEGVEKGAEISDQASDGQSQAGEEHPGAVPPEAAPPTSVPEVPASTPTQADEGLSHRP